MVSREMRRFLGWLVLGCAFVLLPCFADEWESPEAKKAFLDEVHRDIKALGMPLEKQDIVVRVAKRLEGAKISWASSPSVKSGTVGFYISPELEVAGGIFKGDISAAGYIPGKNLTTSEGKKKGYAVYNLLNSVKQEPEKKQAPEKKQDDDWTAEESQESERPWPAVGDGLKWPKSKANARIVRILKDRDQSGAGKETSINIDITIPAQREEFWLVAYLQANAYIDGKPVILRGSSAMDKRWERRKFYMESEMHFPRVDKILGISVMLFDRDNLLVDQKTKGDFKIVSKTLPIVKKTGNGHISCYTK